MTAELTPKTEGTSPLAAISERPEARRLADAVAAGHRVVILSGLSGAARALVLAEIQRRTRRKFVFVTASGQNLEAFQRDLQFFYSVLNGVRDSADQVLLLPASEHNPYDGTSPHPEVLELRARTLFRLTWDKPDFVLMPSRALLQRTVKRDEIATAGAVLKTGEEYLLDELVEAMVASGYVREDPVSEIGQFSLRGGILDLFSPAQSAPVRIEFFGDTVESIREFDQESQRSIRALESCQVVPLREFSASRADLRAWAESAAEYWAEEKYAYELRGKLAAAEDGQTFTGWEYLFALEKPPQSSVFEYLRDYVLVIDEPVEVEQRIAELLEDLAERFTVSQNAGELALPAETLFLTPAELRANLEQKQRLELRVLGKAAASVDAEFAFEGKPATREEPDSFPSILDGDAELENAESVEPDVAPVRSLPSRKARTPLFLFPMERTSPDIHLLTQSVRRFHGHMAEFAGEVKRAAERGASIICAFSSLGLAERLLDMLREFNVAAALKPSLIVDAQATPVPQENIEDQAGIISTVAKLSNGFALPNPDGSAGLVIYTEPDLFDETTRPVELRQEKSTRKRPKSAAFVSDFRDLKPGDYVVHIDHGIGQFQGLQQLSVPNETGRGVTAREFMLLTFAEGARLFVPVERLDLVQKYSSAESGHTPLLDKLGGVAWQKTKARAKKAIRDMADELLKLYAERRMVPGHAFNPDGPWQQEFDDAFEYQLTIDQATAVSDVKADMERATPMDRLLCGDVGYGKTEVAMRAAFKAVMDGKQVAVLTPTTVLAFQHYKTFSGRFSAFPVKIELMSRFRSQKENKATATKIGSGEVDVLVGTHRLLSKDVEFQDLGLVIVDEEQRFGVAHKERLKQLKKKVDVLTMTATPIPRTLNMSLMGLRDMSLIETAPRDRLAIQTSVVQFSEPVIRGAIELELQRGGQIFFIHNRVESIYTIGELLNRIVPTARVGVAHGQMGEKELEAVMLKFVQHELDVLVSTTIIENGIDIPLANTIIINRADAYGLAQLYQLRGRVGRSNRRAYAYLIIPSEDLLSQIARRRLAAIREFSDLGAGFRIAALDLELRGAGNLLGGQQSGHIDTIGFDLYTAMLERTVHELKGEEVEEETRAQVNLGLDIRLPEEYINDMGQRLRAYKRISSARDAETLTEIHSEMEDRYGHLPESAENLFGYAHLRLEADRLGVVAIDRKGDELFIRLAEKAQVDTDKLIGLISSGEEASLTPSGVLRLQVPTGNDLFEPVKKLLRELHR